MKLKERGYHLSPLQNPVGLRVCITNTHGMDFPLMIVNDVKEILQGMGGMDEMEMEMKMGNKGFSGKVLYGASEIVPSFISAGAAKKLLSQIWS